MKLRLVTLLLFSPLLAGCFSFIAPRGKPPAPLIARIVGDGPTADRIATGITLIGKNLDRLREANLLAGSGSALALVGALNIVSRSAERAALEIPPALEGAIAASTDGLFTLEVRNDGGVTRQEVRLLKGETGPAGPRGADGIVVAPFACAADTYVVGVSAQGTAICAAPGFGATLGGTSDTPGLTINNNGTGSALRLAGVATDNGAAVLEVRNDSSALAATGVRAEVTSPAAHAVEINAPGGGALKVTSGNVDFSAAAVRLPITYVTTPSGPNPAAACAANQRAIGGGCFVPNPVTCATTCTAGTPCTCTGAAGVCDAGGTSCVVAARQGCLVSSVSSPACITASGTTAVGYQCFGNGSATAVCITEAAP